MSGFIPIVILAFISAITLILLAVGYVYRSSFPMSFIFFVTGIVYFTIFLTVDAITIDDRAIRVNGTGGSNVDVNITYGNNDYPIKVQDVNGDYTLEPTFVGVMLILISISFIMVGVLIEEHE